MKADRRKENWETENVHVHVCIYFPTPAVKAGAVILNAHTSCVCVFAQGQFNSNSRTNEWSLLSHCTELYTRHHCIMPEKLFYWIQFIFLWLDFKFGHYWDLIYKIPKKKLTLLFFLSFVLCTLDFAILNEDFFSWLTFELLVSMNAWKLPVLHGMLL